MIQLFDAASEYTAHQEQIEAATLDALRSGQYIMGPKLAAFEHEFAQYLKIPAVFGVGNGYDALTIALRALHIGQGDEVIVPSHTFIASVLPIIALGATPILVDVDPYYHLDVNAVSEAIGPKTKAIMVVHLYGQLAQIEELVALAKSRSLYLIEDACQAHGAKKNGRMAGTFGDIGCFSFYPTKNLGAYGDAGAIVTASPELAAKIQMLRNYGSTVKYHHEIFGYNSRLDEVQAAILSVKLTYLDQSIHKRQTLAALYDEALADIPQITLPLVRTREQHAYHLYVIQAQDRDGLMAHLKHASIQSMVHYPVPVHHQPAIKAALKYPLPVTETFAGTVLSIPLHPFMEKEDVLAVSTAIREYYAS